MIDLPSFASVCRRCLEEDVSAAALAEHLDNYIASLPEEVRASPGTYEKRLSLCAECPKRIGILCSVCGCYVQARAAKRGMQCPIDFGEPKWRREPD